MKKNLSNIMATAWQFFRITGEGFPECLKRAWLVNRLGTGMQNGICRFYYRKLNGDVRQAFGTLEESVLAGKVKGAERKANPLVFRYWDTEVQAFRSFKKFNLIRIA